MQALRQTAAVSRGFVDLSRFFAGTLGFFVFAKIGESPALSISCTSQQEFGSLLALLAVPRALPCLA